MMRYIRTIPPFKTLLAVEAAARLKSFTRAGEELNISQSAVSHAVTQAEQFLDTRLFDRSARPVALTPEGRDYVASLSSCLGRLAEDAQALRQRKAREILTISCNLANGTYWLLPRLKAFQERFPDIQVNMVTTLEGLAALHDGIDVAIRFGDGKWPGTEAKLLFREQILAVAAPSYLRQITPVTRPADLLKHRLLHARSSERSWYDWPQWFAHFGVRTHGELPGSTFDNHLLMMQAAASGRGVALGWVATATGLFQDGLLEPVLHRPIMLTEGLYVVRRVGKDNRSKAFVDWIAENTKGDFASRASAHWILQND